MAPRNTPAPATGTGLATIDRERAIKMRPLCIRVPGMPGRDVFVDLEDTLG
jgi:hypothetical protein